MREVAAQWRRLAADAEICQLSEISEPAARTFARDRPSAPKSAGPYCNALSFRPKARDLRNAVPLLNYGARVTSLPGFPVVRQNAVIGSDYVGTLPN